MSPKIRKKDPCPCGSGKKYRDCCFKTKKYSNTEALKTEPGDGEMNQKPLVSRLALMKFDVDLQEDEELVQELTKLLKKKFPEKDFEGFFSELWNSKKVGEMSTEEIIAKLETMDVSFCLEKLKEQAKQYISAIKLADEQYYPEEWDEMDPDGDFIWLAICELWKRFIPEQYNVEMLDDALHNGYKLILHKDYEKGLKEWETAWDILKIIVPSSITSIEEADAFMPYPLTHFLFDWCQDFEEQLYRVEQKDGTWGSKRSTYLHEFVQRFPDTESSVIQHMMKAGAKRSG